MPERITNIRKGTPGNAVHDVGGLDFGPVDREEHDLSLYEKRVDALLMLLAGPKNSAFRVDALRRTVEDYAEQEYDGTPYYDRWIRAIRNLLLEQEIVTEAELDAKIASVCDRLEAEGQIVSRKPVP
ncbi:MAG: ScnB-like protein [Pseudomonadota bacterium]